jgi:hypothetical protein
MQTLSKSSILDQLKAKPIAKNVVGIDLLLAIEPTRSLVIEDKRTDFEHISYDKLIGDLKSSISVENNTKKNKKSNINVVLDDMKQPHKNDAGITYIFIRKVNGSVVNIMVDKKIDDHSFEYNNVKIIVEGELINTKKLPRQSKNTLIDFKRMSSMSYYLNNRQIFIQFINNFFNSYKADLLADDTKSSLSCNNTINESNEFSLLLHQKIVRDYLNLFTPYRGLLLYHGLGSGKTCSSIAIAEGFTTQKKVIVLTPKSLLRNYVEELKSCGDPLYKQNYFWSFVSVYQVTKSTGKNIMDGKAVKGNLVQQLMTELGLSESFILQKGGAWVPDSSRKPNFHKLPILEQKSILYQIDVIINIKYNFVAYNGLRKDNLYQKLQTFNGTKNPFDNKVIVIDEAHNFVSRIVNKLKKKSDSSSVSIILYNWLLSAVNCRIVLLTGTPIINFPFELAVMCNILRGYIRQWTIKFPSSVQSKLSNDYFKSLFKKHLLNNSYDTDDISVKKSTKCFLDDILDEIDYKPSTRTLTFTRNPYGFMNKYKKTQYLGIRFDEGNQFTDQNISDELFTMLQSNKIKMDIKNITISNFTAFDADRDKFEDMFIDIKKRELKNPNLFKRRILGLTSYFKSPQESLMPSFNKDIDLSILRIPMSKYQLGVYEEARVQERKLEQNISKKKKNPLYADDAKSTYRIYSRSFCNFVFPENTKRPIPKSFDEKNERFDDDNEHEVDDLFSTDKAYQTRIFDALSMLKEQSADIFSPSGLALYSPKFVEVLKNIQNPLFKGLHLVYSNFKTLEGIGILKLVLLANGFVEFKISKSSSNIWTINMKPEDIGKPAFVLYTGDEDDDTKEIYRNIYNNLWDNVPVTISEVLKNVTHNNIYGDIIKIFMITSSGAEGISLKNCRFVHIIEPYWHHVRIEQVIGRARRICSHEELPLVERNIKVFIYLMTFSDEQLKNQLSTELLLKDKSQLDNKTIVTTDEHIFEKSNLKEQINKRFTHAIKEAAIDCNIHKSKTDKDRYSCYSYTNPNINNYIYAPSIYDDNTDDIQDLNEVTTKLVAKKIEIDGLLYAMSEDFKLYDFDSYVIAQHNPGQAPIFIGTLDIENKKIIFAEGS